MQKRHVVFAIKLYVIHKLSSAIESTKNWILIKMCSTKPVVDHLVLTETGSDNIGDVEINEWSELLTNEHEIAITRNNPVSLTAITESSRKINGKFKRAAEPITSTWNNRNSYSNNANNSFISRSFEGVPMDSLTSPPPPKLPPKSSNIINNLNLNGNVVGLVWAWWLHVYSCWLGSIRNNQTPWLLLQFVSPIFHKPSAFFDSNFRFICFLASKWTEKSSPRLSFY